MSKLKAAGRLLAANREDRTLRYRLLPFGEPGNTNMGKVIASAGSIEIPSSPLPVNIEHDYTRPVGTMIAEETPEGLDAVVTIANTRAGDDVLEEAATGLRAGISVEVDNPVIRAGRFVKGLLSGSGLVVKPAYPSALLMAADVGEVDPDVDVETEAVELADAAAHLSQAVDAGDAEAAAAAIAEAEAAIEAAKDKLTESAEPAQEENNMPPTATASAPANTEALLATLAGLIGKPSDQGPASKLTAGNEITLDKFTAAIRGMADTTDGRLKAAALDTITQADVYDPTSVPAYLGEVWASQPYEERFTPLVDHADLTGMKVTGWRWVEGKSPIVDDWDPAFSGSAPNESMNDIPTGEVVAEDYSETAKRIAGGNRFDRVHFDFPVPGVIESFLANQAEYIARRRDQRTQEHIYAHAKLISGTGADVANPWRRIILGAMHVQEYSTPTYAIVGNDLYRDMLGSDMLENLALLEASLGLKEGSLAGFKIKPASITDTASNGKVIVGASRATVLHEPAGAPFRVDAEELLKGAVDKAVFAYYLLRSDERGGIVEVPAGA